MIVFRQAKQFLRINSCKIAYSSVIMAKVWFKLHVEIRRKRTRILFAVSTVGFYRAVFLRGQSR